MLVDLCLVKLRSTVVASTDVSVDFERIGVQQILTSEKRSRI